MTNRDRAIVDAEDTVLAVLLNDSYAVVPVMGALQPEDFSDPVRAAIYSTVLDCVRCQVVPNTNTVAVRLPTVSIDVLQDISRHFNTKANKEVLYIAGEVANAATVRRVQDAAKDIEIEATKAPADLDGFVNYAMNLLAQSIEGHAERDASITAALGELDAAIAEAENGIRGTTTGLSWLDETTGGFCGSHVWMITAPYKMRKTTLMRNMVIATCEAGASVDVYALEGDARGTAAGLLAMLATRALISVDAEDKHKVLSETHIESGLRTPEQRQAIEIARRELAGYNVRIYDSKHGIADFAKLALKIKRNRFMFGMNIFFLDYLQRMRGDGKLFDRVERNTHMLQDAITSEGVTGVILAQLNEATVRAGSDDDSYSPGVKGGGDPAAAADYLLKTNYDGETAPDKLTVQLKLARHAQPGKREYTINPQSGWIETGRASL